jgi:hypothetical protein
MKFHPCIQDVLSLLALESFLSSSSMRQLLVQVSHNLLLSSSFGHSLLLLFFFLIRVEFSRKRFLLLLSQSLLIVSSRLHLSFHNYPIHFLFSKHVFELAIFNLNMLQFFKNLIFLLNHLCFMIFFFFIGLFFFSVISFNPWMRTFKFNMSYSFTIKEKELTSICFFEI